MRERFFGKRDKPFAKNLAEFISMKLSNERTWDPFSSLDKTPITLEEYLLRFLRYIDADRKLYLLMLIYLNNYAEAKPENSLNPYTIHRLVVCSLLMATKFCCDRPYKNSVFAKVAGLPVKELNHLEFLFFSSLQFKLYVDVDVDLYASGKKIIEHCDSMRP